MPSSEPDALQCRICSRAFKRLGHLRRHEAIHSSVRAFACPQCARNFSRRDALQRHVQSHKAPSLRQGNRACISCASAKSRCSGETPCKRCYERGAACAYPSTEMEIPMQPTDDVPGEASGGMSSALPLAEMQLILPNSPGQLSNNLMTPIGDYSYNDWDGFFHETNWLEAPINAEIHWSPHSWDFQSYDHTVNTLGDDSFAHNSDQGNIGPGPHEISANGTEDSPVESARPGEYYVDGEPARLPRVKRWKSAVEVPLATFSGTFSMQLHEPISFTHAKGHAQISETNYRTLLDLYNRLCCSDGVFGARFTDHDLPDRFALDALLTMYREKFENVLPFLHWTVFHGNDRHPLLDLAVIAVGSQFICNVPFSISMQEFTRRCLHFTDDFSAEFEYVPIAAALLLNIVGCAYCGDDRLRQHALQARARLRFYFDRLKNEIDDSLLDSAPDSSMEQWQLWIRRESNVRLVGAIWLVDAMLTAHFDVAPTFDLDSLKVSLPCQDNIWRCYEIGEWSKLRNTKCQEVPFLDTLQKLYSTKSFSATHCEFARILVIHGLFHRLWEVERYYSKPLSHWEPSSAPQSGEIPFPSTPIWLPSVPAFRNWQNSSCDALDVLHWQANSTIGQMRGIEHPTVLHLHFARLVLLCPGHEIISLARSLTTTVRGAIDRSSVNKATELVRRWALHHQYKARLAAIHAGVIFWHIRRHGVDAFYEPQSLALAALVLWAFSMFAERKSQQIQPSSTAQDSAESVQSSVPGSRNGGNIIAEGTQAECCYTSDVILLDRPTDDELVQQFIVEGASMTPFMSGVAEVFSPRAPPRILDRGVELLRGQRCWGGSVEWIQLLQSLRASRRIESSSR